MSYKKEYTFVGSVLPHGGDAATAYMSLQKSQTLFDVIPTLLKKKLASPKDKVPNAIKWRVCFPCFKTSDAEEGNLFVKISLISEYDIREGKFPPVDKVVLFLCPQDLAEAFDPTFSQHLANLSKTFARVVCFIYGELTKGKQMVDVWWTRVKEIIPPQQKMEIKLVPDAVAVYEEVSKLIF